MLFSEPLKEHIEKKVCPVHNIHPIIEVDLNELKIAACCKDFELQCLEDAEKLINPSNVS
ncbi:MAG TPA: hypothetical protein VL442_19420 [Mucilaginibacter sp.]|jgi:hypothetical protein|nr:hypothetical protein [Mucilaginibacter sp.]